MCFISFFQHLSELFSHYFIHKMSKKMCLRSDSFDDRICDDLSEVILQYLPLKDKIRLECVSKQFHRSVFQKQNEIILELKLKGEPRLPMRFDCPNKLNFLRLEYPRAYEVLEEMDPQLEILAFKSCHYKPIESLLKKCLNIQSIDLFRIYSNNSQISKLMLQMITKYCNHLIEFKVLRFDSNECESQKFCRKFGQKLKYFRSAENLFDFNLFPNIESIDVLNVKRIDNIEDRVEEILKLNSNKIKELEFEIDMNMEHLLPKFLQKFDKLTQLRVKLRTHALNETFMDFPFLQNLLDLVISGVNQDFEEMCDLLKQIAIKCVKLKSLVLDSKIILKNISEVKQLFQILKAFPALKRLNFGLDTGTDINQWFSFELFKDFPQQLTHLSLNLFNRPLNESLIKGIDIYLPKIQDLYIWCPLKTNTEGLTQMADILSRLSGLQTFVLWCDPEVDHKPMEDMIIEKCVKIKTIILYNK